VKYGLGGKSVCALTERKFKNWVMMRIVSIAVSINEIAFVFRLISPLAELNSCCVLISY
jgi:hypothetical protein